MHKSQKKKQKESNTIFLGYSELEFSVKSKA